MSKRGKSLTATEIKAAVAKEKVYIMYDGLGLELHVQTTGSKIWRFRYSSPKDGKRVIITLGPYPKLSLVDARRLVDEHRASIVDKIDPKDLLQEKEDNRKSDNENTFFKIAESYLIVKKKKGLKEQTVHDFWRLLEMYIFPTLGNKPVSEITAPVLLKTIEPVMASGKLEQVKRLNQRVNEVLFHAVHIGAIPANPCAQLHRALIKPKAKPKPNPYLTLDEIPKFLSDLYKASMALQTRYLILFQMLTMVRPSEASNAEWKEIDFDKKEWTIPKDKMKMDKLHIVPLSTQALKILEEMKRISGHRDFVFPQLHYNKNQPMSSQSANMAIKRMGYKDKLTAHGLRATASTALNDLGHDYRVVDAALAHTEKNEVERVYNRSTYLEQRRELMQKWGDYVELKAVTSLL